MARAGLASRRGADELIARGQVRVNGRVVRELGTLVGDGDAIEVAGERVRQPDAFAYLVLHKPAGVVTTMRDPQGRRTVAALLPRDRRLVPVGRLDYDSSGVLLATDDGALAHRLLHPRFGVDKRYRATIAGRLSAADVRRIADGVVLDGTATHGAKVRVVAAGRTHSVVDITVHEGRNRQVRRMFEALGHPVTALTRVRFGPIALGRLAPGAVRELTARERLALQRHRDGG